MRATSKENNFRKEYEDLLNDYSMHVFKHGGILKEIVLDEVGFNYFKKLLNKESSDESFVYEGDLISIRILKK